MGDFMERIKRIECLTDELLAEDLLWQRLVPVGGHCDDDVHRGISNVLHHGVTPHQGFDGWSVAGCVYSSAPGRALASARHGCHLKRLR